MKTLNEQYKLIKEDKGHKNMFLNEAKRFFPNYIRNSATFEEAEKILKQKGVITENFTGLEPINSPFTAKNKESYELAFEKFLEEAKSPEIKAKEVKAKTVKSQEETEKAELKKTSKQVEEDQENIYDQKDDKNIDNMIFDQVMTGYYAELKDPKNEDKTMEQLKDIVLKNIAKDPIFYTKDGQFGVKGLGYTTEAPGLGEPKEAKGKYKASGYGDLNESMDEAYQLVNINLKGAKKDREERDPSDKYLTFDKDFEKDQRRKGNLIVKDENRIFITKVLHANLGPKAGNAYLRKHLMDRTNIEPAVLGGQQVWKIKGAKINSKGNISVFVPVEKTAENKNMNIQETKLRKVISTIIREELAKKPLNENVDKRLKEIEAEAAMEAMGSKMEKIMAEIEKRQSQLSRLDEDEDLKAMMDKKATSKIQKEIKLLEKAKTKIEKIMGKGKGKKKEVIDEMEDTEENPEFEKAAIRAEEMYNNGLEIEDIVSKFNPSMRNDLERHLRMGFEGSDND